MATTSKRLLGGCLAAPLLAFGFIAACGLDAVGKAGLDEPVARPDGSPTVEDEGGAPPDAKPPDAKPPETCAWPSLERDAPWPMIGGCVGHPGRTVHRGPKQQPKIVWKVTITTRESQPVIAADGTIYVPADTSGVAVFAPDGGRQSFDAGGGPGSNVTNAPSIGADGTLYFGDARDVVAQGKDGTRWRFPTNGEIDTSTLVDEDGTVYSGSFDDSFYALGPDGGVRWKVGLGGDIWAAPAIGPTGDIYVGANDRLYALERDGGQSWAFATTGNLHSSPVIADDGTIYIGTTNARLHAILPDGGAKWAFATKGNFGWQQLPAVGTDGTVYTATDKHLAAIAPSDGGALWERDLGVTLRTSVVVDGDGDLYVGGDSHMYAYDRSGKQLWMLDIGSNPFGFAIGRDGTMFVACNGNTLLALHD